MQFFNIILAVDLIQLEENIISAVGRCAAMKGEHDCKRTKSKTVIRHSSPVKRTKKF